jgi:hypothetical protein
LCIVEGLLVARFWFQLAAVNASDGLQAMVLELSQPLVAPFSDPETSAQGSVGSFERKTLLAAMVYLIVGVAMAVTTMLAGGLASGAGLVSTRRRRNVLQHLEQPALNHSAARLLGTVSLNLSPDQAMRALKMMHLDRFGAELYVIPVSGGSVIAAFAGSSKGHWPLLGRLDSTREAIALKRAFRNIERRFQPATSPSVDPASLAGLG